MTAASPKRQHPELVQVIDITDRQVKTVADDSAVTPDDRAVSPNDLREEDTEYAWTFAEVGQWLNQKPNTISARWFPRILEAHEGVKSLPLRVDIGGGRMRLTTYGARAIAHFVALCVDGKTTDTRYREIIKTRWGVDSAVEQPITADEIAEAEYIEPEQPQTSALARIRDVVPQAQDDQAQAIATALATINRYSNRSGAMSQLNRQARRTSAFTQRLLELTDELEARTEAEEFFYNQLENAGLSEEEIAARQGNG